VCRFGTATLAVEFLDLFRALVPAARGPRADASPTDELFFTSKGTRNLVGAPLTKVEPAKHRKRPGGSHLQAANKFVLLKESGL
jgi:hypothetical protein